MDSDRSDIPADVAEGRRAFLKRMAALAFAAPVVASFTLDGTAFANPPHDKHDSHNQYGQNQTVPVKPPPNQYGQNQTVPVNPPPNQYGQNQTGQICEPNQYQGNQTVDKGPPNKRGKIRFA